METVKIALAGNPNSGKTTLFNALTGSNQYVGNWPGVTVEKKEGRLRGHREVVIQDLPGIYSLSPYTLEEVVARDHLTKERPQAILNIVDGTNMERNLYLTTQLLELDIPVVVAVNMMDLAEKNGQELDLAKLSQALGCPVVALSALKGAGVEELVQTVLAAARAGGGQQAPGELERCLTQARADGEDPEETEAAGRYDFIAQVVAQGVRKDREAGTLTTSDKVDRIVTNRVLALPIFACVMFFVYAIAMGSYPFSVGTLGTDWANGVLFGELVPGFLDSLLLNAAGEPAVWPWLYGLIRDGIVAGVGAVLGFVPQILVLCLLLAVLEDIGYMARVAFIMDRLFRRFGLSGKSFIPLLVATGCGVPGIMATRTIEQDRDRKLTIMTTGFIPCGAKLPIIALFAGAVFGGSAWVAVSAFFTGIAAVVVSGIILKKTRAFAGEPAPFVMELPPYHVPSVGNVLRATWERGWSFIKRAGTVVLLSSIVLWFLQGYGFVDGVFQAVEDNGHSLLAAIGNAAAWVFYPLGWVGDMAWKATVATFTGLIAKEEVVNLFGVVYHYAGETDLMEDSSPIWAMVAADFGPVRAYSFMIFNLLCAPCFAAMGAIRREMNNAKWTLGAIGYMCAFAYVAAMVVYQLGGLISGETGFGVFTLVALGALGGVIYLLLRKGADPDHTAAGPSSVAAAGSGCGGNCGKCKGCR